MKVPPSNTRWVILGLMVGVSSVAYLHRLNFQVAAEAMGPDLGLSLVQMGWVFAAFNYSYAFFNSRAESGAGVGDPASH